jgi:hypothetical protein
MMEHEIAPDRFDGYYDLRTETQRTIDLATKELRSIDKRTIEDIIRRGEILSGVQSELADHHQGTFQSWAKAELGYSLQTTYRFMRAYEFSLSHNNLLRLPIEPSAVYALAAPKTPDAARMEAIELAERGETVSHKTTESIIGRHKTPSEPPTAPNFSDQPVSHVRWVHRSLLRANGYNPNAVSPIELDLLTVSICEDGWTQPIVARTDGEIVDGYHRWLVSERLEIYAMTGGYVPVVYLDKPLADQMLSTIRHNRARGVHGVTPMSEIVRTLKDKHGMTDKQIRARLGMDDEEIERLYDSASIPERVGKGGEFGKGWAPKPSDSERTEHGR